MANVSHNVTKLSKTIQKHLIGFSKKLPASAQKRKTHDDIKVL